MPFQGHIESFRLCPTRRLVGVAPLAYAATVAGL
jgi:hypothetical protein